MLILFTYLLPSERLAQLSDQVNNRYREILFYLESLQNCATDTGGIRFTIDLGFATLRAKLNCIQTDRAKLLAKYAAVPQGWLECAS